MKLQMINRDQKPEPIAEDIPEDPKIFEDEKPTKTVMGFPCTISLIVYALAAAILLVPIFRDESDEKKETISTLLMLKTYAWMSLLASLFIPFDDNYDAGNSRCSKISKIVFIFFSMLIHFIGIPLFSDLLSSGDKTIIAATFFHGLGFIFEGYYFRNAIVFLFCEQTAGFQGFIPYDTPPMFGIV